MKNNKKLILDDVYPETKSYKQLSFTKDLIFWVDNISSKKGKRNTIFVRPFNKNEVSPQNLIGDNFCIKSNFHGYGGKAYKCFYIKEKFYLIWIDQISNSIWLQSYEINKLNDKNDNYLSCLSSPIQLTNSLDVNFDSSFVLFDEVKLFGIFEQNEKDYLFSIDINKENKKIEIIKKFDAFAGSLSCNEDQTIFSWIEWDSKSMSWEENSLFFAEINTLGKLNKIVEFKNKNINLNRSVSFFQPLWISKNIFICSEDSTGWWNLLFLEISHLDDINIIGTIKKNFSEYGLPEWISGSSLFSGSRENLFCLSKNKESWILENFKDLSFHKKIDLPFTSLRDLQVYENKLVCIASNNSSHEKLLEIDMDQCINKLSTLKEIRPQNLSYISVSESYWFKGFRNKATHSWLYRPYTHKKELLPLIVRVHGGPTDSFSGDLNLEVQYWVSRGWCVAEVNYAGSSGFGKNYRQRLNNHWGIADSYDCNALAQTLIKTKLIDPNKIIITGNSAGGFTALNSLIQSDIFTAAICKYPVIDLIEMNQNTHRFERNYLNSLLGNYETNREKYYVRSPKNNLSKIKNPILIFHGKQDTVVNYKGSYDFYKKLIANNIYSKIFLFNDEGHGFKNNNNKKFVLEKTDKFIQTVLQTKNLSLGN